MRAPKREAPSLRFSLVLSVLLAGCAATTKGGGSHQEWTKAEPGDTSTVTRGELRLERIILSVEERPRVEGARLEPSHQSARPLEVVLPLRVVDPGRLVVKLGAQVIVECYLGWGEDQRLRVGRLKADSPAALPVVIDSEAGQEEVEVHIADGNRAEEILTLIYEWDWKHQGKPALTRTWWLQRWPRDDSFGQATNEVRSLQKMKLSEPRMTREGPLIQERPIVLAQAPPMSSCQAHAILCSEKAAEATESSGQIVLRSRQLSDAAVGPQTVPGAGFQPMTQAEMAAEVGAETGAELAVEAEMAVAAEAEAGTAAEAVTSTNGTPWLTKLGAAISAFVIGGGTTVPMADPVPEGSSGPRTEPTRQGETQSMPGQPGEATEAPSDSSSEPMVAPSAQDEGERMEAASRSTLPPGVRTALGDGPEVRGMRETDKAGAGLAERPQHHVLPNEHRPWFEQHGFTGDMSIDEFCVELEEAHHQAVHGGGDWRLGRTWPGEWNHMIMRTLNNAETSAGRMLTRDEILEIVGVAMKRYGIPMNFTRWRGR